jgi:hypothetical protein
VVTDEVLLEEVLQLGLPRPALELMLGDDTLEVRPGTWVHMPKGLRHSIQAKTPVVRLLLPVKGPRP